MRGKLLQTAPDCNPFRKGAAHAVRELLALPEPPEVLAASLARMADSPAEPAEWRELCRGFLRARTPGDAKETHAGSAE